MSNKKIGIVGWQIGDAFGVTIPYMDYFSNFGNVEILMPFDKIRDLDLVVLPGGPDVDTSRYGEKPKFRTSKPCPFRENFDEVYLPQYIKNGTSIFAVCRGHQSLAVYFGSKLIQHIKKHSTNKPQDRSETVHNIKIIKTGELIPVNSMHHQVVDKSGFNYKELEILAVSEKEGYIEAMKHKYLNISSVQFHPEELEDTEYTDNMIKELLNINTTCKKQEKEILTV